ncbi:hypothetical protein [Ideonella sp. YS5]|uniref:hypothetical protein n=1 Tax=Ideonella sp. YS5 TaxID=3453714 RepID=UPI003EEDBD1B
MGKEFPDHRERLFGREPDIHRLLDRARKPGLTALVARPMMGKTWTLQELARRLLEEGRFLVGYHQSTGAETSNLLYAVSNLYARWLADSTMRDQALSLWQRHKASLVPRVGQMVGLLFDKLAGKQFPEGVAATVRSAFDGLAEAQRDLLIGGLQLAPLPYDQAQSLVDLVVKISNRRVVLILDAWEKSLSLRAEHATLENILKQIVEWHSTHVLIAIRSPQQAVGVKFADEALQHAENLCQLSAYAAIQRLEATIGSEQRERRRMLEYVRSIVPAASSESDETLLLWIDNYPGVLDRWTASASTGSSLASEDLSRIAADAHALRYTDLHQVLNGLSDSRLAFAAALACFPSLDAEAWEIHKSILLNGHDQSSIDALVDASVLDLQDSFPSYGHDTRHAAARRWFEQHKLALWRRTAADLVRSLATGITGVNSASRPRFEALVALDEVASEAGVDSTTRCFIGAAWAAFDNYEPVHGEPFNRWYLEAARRTPAAADLLALALCLRGLTVGESGDSAAAIADYTAAIELPGASVNQVAKALLHRGHSRYGHGDGDAAVADWTAAIKLAGASSELAARALVCRGAVMGERGNSEAAISDCTAAIELSGAPAKLIANALLIRGITKNRRRDTNAAIADWTAAIEVPGALPEEVAMALVYRGIAIGKLNDSEAAIADFTAAIELPGAPVDQVAEALVERGLRMSERGDIDAAIADWTAAIQVPGAPAEKVVASLVNRAEARGQYGDSEAAIVDYTAAIRWPGGPADLVAKALLGRGVERNELGDSEAAIADWTAAIELPGAPVDEVAVALVNRGFSREEGGDSDSAIADYTAAIILPGAPAYQVAKAFIVRGVRWEKRGDGRAAIADWTSAIELPDAPADQVSHALVCRGGARDKCGDTEAAIADFTAAIGLPGAPASQVASALFQRAVTSSRRGDHEATIADYTAVIDLPGASADRVARSLLGRGFARSKRGDGGEAIADWSAALQLPGAPADVVAVVRFSRGFANRERGDNEAAIAEYAAVVEMPGAPAQLVALAREALKELLSSGSSGA